MAKAPSSEPKEQTSEPPAPEVLSPRADDGTVPPEPTAGNGAAAKGPKRPRRATYRPSHKATFIALAVVAGILAVNAGIIAFVLHAESKAKAQASQGQVSISQSSLSKLGVNRAPLGDAGVQLLVNPDAKFNGKVTIGGDVSIGGQLKLNSTFTANSASLTQLQAGNTSLNSLNVNSDSTVSNLSVRGDMQVGGATHFQGAVTLGQLLTVNNGVNITGNLAVGGTLTVNAFHSSTLVTDNGITLGGHVITRGSAPSVGPGSALGSYGTVSISGNDAAGTVGVNIGAGASGGILAYVSFRSAYDVTPHVVVTPIGGPIGNFYVNRSASGFSIGVGSGAAPGGYAFDYIVEQ